MVLYQQINRKILLLRSINRNNNTNNILLGLNLNLNLNQKCFINKTNIYLNNDEKNNKRNILKEKLLKKSFIQLNEFKQKPLNVQQTPIKKPQTAPVETPTQAKTQETKLSSSSSEPTVEKQKSFLQQLREKEYKLRKKIKEENKEEFKSDAIKVAKLVTKEPAKVAETAEYLLEPLKKLRKKEQKEKKKINEENLNKKTDSEFRSLIKTNENIGDDEKFKKEKKEIENQKPKLTRGWQGSPYQEYQSLKSGIGLSLFTSLKPTETNLTVESAIWTMHYNDELKQAQEIPPINGFDEMIQLTNEGKLWKFPIDNEQDIDELDAQIPFHEHVFLDNYLEEFPQIEPIQQFMTLALNGISQNSFLSLNEKKEIINWYKNYFNDKLDVIKEALEAEKLEVSFRESLEKKAQ